MRMANDLLRSCTASYLFIDRQVAIARGKIQMEACCFTIDFTESTVSSHGVESNKKSNEQRANTGFPLPGSAGNGKRVAISKAKSRLSVAPVRRDYRPGHHLIWLGSYVLRRKCIFLAAQAPPSGFARISQSIVCALAVILASRASYRAGATHLRNLLTICNHWCTVTGWDK